MVSIIVTISCLFVASSALKVKDDEDPDPTGAAHGNRYSDDPWSKHWKQFSFIEDDGQVIKMTVAVDGYDAETNTYDFPPCKDKDGNQVCFQAGCMGRCGSGCAKTTGKSGEADMANCKPLSKAMDLSAFEDAVGPLANNAEAAKCRSDCLNHDLCSYAMNCPGSVFGPGSQPFKTEKPIKCDLVKFASAASYMASVMQNPMGKCPAHFKGYTSLAHEMTYGLRQKSNVTSNAQGKLLEGLKPKKKSDLILKKQEAKSFDTKQVPLSKDNCGSQCQHFAMPAMGPDFVGLSVTDCVAKCAIKFP